MSEYYGIPSTPNENFLAHYGVRGMKWGIRRAIARGDQAALSKHYQKAARKLGKLSLNANQDLQKKRWASAKSRMGQGAAMSAGISAGLTAAANPGSGFQRRALLAGGAGLAGAAAGALANSKGAGARRYISDKGHAKALRKRNEWVHEMESAFKGTRYGGRQQKQFHREIMALSKTKNPRGYVQGQIRKNDAELRRYKQKRRR